MRKYALLEKPFGKTRKVMLYQSDDGTYLFLYNNTHKDSPGFADYWFETLEDAQAAAIEYNIAKDEWINIDDPLPDCQQDIITPIRIKGRNARKPQWGRYEKLVNGEWIDFTFAS